MRLLCLTLLVANVVFFAYTRLYPGDSEDSGQRVAQIDLQAERVEMQPLHRVRPPANPVAPIDPEPQTPPPPSPPAPVPACLEWAGIAPEEIDRSRVLLESMDASYEVVSGGDPTAPYWVRIRGVATRAEVDAIVAQLRAAGERDFAVARDAPQGTYIVSLGLFRSEANAQRMHERFADLGAVLTPEGAEPTVYLVRTASAEVAEQISAAASDFADTTATAVPCPQP
jgi:hypothetical protein